MITTFYPPYNFGGDGIFVHSLSNELAKRGHRVDVIHCIDSYNLLSGNKKPIYYENHPNIRVHGLRSRYGYLSPIASYLSGLPLLKVNHIRKILEKDFDVIHFHNISLVGGPKILEYGQGIKLITAHDYWLVCPTHVLFKFNQYACEKPECLYCTLAYKRPVQFWRYLGKIKEPITCLDALIAPSEFAIKIHKDFGITTKMVHLPNFVPPVSEEFPQNSNDRLKSSQNPFFLFLGRLEKLKGLQTIIPLFSKFKKADLLIAGSGSYEPSLRKLAEGIQNVRFLGFLGNKELHALLPKCLAVVIPSLSYETSSLVLMEAFRQKVPVIGRKFGAIKEQMELSGGGIVYETQEELLGAMEQIIENESLRDKMGLSGYNAYRKHWTPENHINKYLDLIYGIEHSRAELTSKIESPIIY